MRKEYEEGNCTVAWGDDAKVGLFVQVFDESKDESLIVDLDQAPMSRGIDDMWLTKEKAIAELEKYSPSALRDFKAYVEQAE